VKILIVAPEFPIDSETFIINQAIGLNLSGCEVDIFALVKRNNTVHHDKITKFNLMNRFRFLYSSKKNNLAIVMICVIGLIKSVLYPRRWRKILNIIFDRNLIAKQKINILNYIAWNDGYIGRYDNVLVHFGSFGLFVIKMRGLGYLDGPVSVIFHAHEISQKKLIAKYYSEYQALFKQADSLLPISHFWRQRLISWGAPLDKTLVHRMGVSLDDFSFHSRPFDQQGALRVIQVGRLVEKKAILDTIQAVVDAKPQIDLELTVIGDGPLMQEALLLIKQHRAEHYIKMLGSQSQTEVQKQLEQADIFMLPSVTATNGDMEGVPVALMEAMAMGLIVVSTQHSGIPELIDDGVSGFLANERSPAELCDILLKVQQLDSTRVNQIRQAARDKVAAEFSDVICYQQLIELTERLSAQYDHPN
jgi:colanic acid/amylovoran biosynthesis glycosyltransferase